jgi:outer membrane receptor for ferrienterochelin and colicins
LNGFYNDIRDIITLAQVNGTLYSYINVERYKTVGGEFKVGTSIYPRLTLNVGVGETGRLNTVATTTEDVNEFKFTTDVTSDLSYKFPKQELSLSVFYKYNGKMPQFFVEDGEIVEGYIEDYNTMDITANKGFMHNRIRLSTGVKNVFNVTTLGAVGGTGGAHGGGGVSTNVGWGRSFFVKLSFNFNLYN